MKKYARVFLKGEPIRWFDFPLNDASTGIFEFIGQARHEGGAIMQYGFIPWDCFGPVMFISTSIAPVMPSWAMGTVGQA